MNKTMRTIFTMLCIAGMGVSFAYHTRTTLSLLVNLKAPVNINIEVDKNYARFMSIIASLNSGETLFQLSPTTAYSETMKTIILHTDAGTGSIPPYIYDVFLRLPQEHALETLAAIDGISIFIGNKFFYFSGADILALKGIERNEYTLYRLPNLQYKKSAMARWINWYGDFNFILKTTMAFFVYPARYFMTWFFVVCLFFLYQSRLQSQIAAAYKKSRLAEIFILAAIALIGFLLRVNGYVQNSAWIDELYSAGMASNPHQPFLNAIGDPGNPPLYFICLRLWFMLFGWSEQSGRMLSVLIGTAAIISMYVVTASFSGKKAGFLAALLMATNTYLIGLSQDMRGYILEVFLISIVALRFLVFIRCQTIKNMAWYIIPCILIVNTHYYGVFAVIANFLFFLCSALWRKNFSWKSAVSFLSGNIITTLSLLPFFVYTAFSEALFDKSFNTWIQKPGMIFMALATLAPIVLFVYFYVRKNILQHNNTENKYYLIDYAVFSIGVIFMFAFIISLVRPMLVEKYLVICVPFLLVIPSVFLTSSPVKFAMPVGGIFIYSVMLTGYEANPGGGIDVYKESQAYIIRDAHAHTEKHNLELFYLSHDKEDAPKIQHEYTDREKRALLLRSGFADFYEYNQLPYYTPGIQYDVLYVNPLHFSESDMYKEMARYGIDDKNIVRIRVNDKKTIVKKYR
ncbi:MAG: glycosyltransferase family 39 protein [Treponema sp.]|jgi:hypothetical protein|nr:glycosyltransferase family 39 protein [Treponema sp.]